LRDRLLLGKPIETERDFRLTGLTGIQMIPAARVGPTSMRKALSRSEQDEHGTSQTSIQHHPLLRSTMSDMRLLPFTPAASQCSMSHHGMQPESRSRS